jgi:hypothetical protein
MESRDQQARAEAARIRIKLTVRDQEFFVPPAGLLPIGDKIAVRQATGLSFESYMRTNTIGEDSLAVLYWLGRRQTEPLLGWNTAVEDWYDLDLEPGEVTAEYIDLSGETTEADHPE